MDSRDRSAALTDDEKRMLQQPLSQEEQAALVMALREAPTDACLSSEELVDLVTGSMPADLQSLRSKALREHLQGCPICAGTAIDLRKAFAPVIALQNGWYGWRGPILAAFGLLNPTLARAWKEHCVRSPECAHRTEAIGRTNRVARPALTFASGVACTAVVLLLFRPATTITPGRFGLPGSTPGFTIVPKGGLPDVSDQTGNPAEKVIERAFNPLPEQVPAATRILEHIVARNPGLQAPRIALSELYRRAMLTEKDPARRRALQAKRDRLDTVRASR